MLDKNKIREIATKSKKEHWPYPKIFNALQEAGVECYEVHVPTNQVVYHGKGQQVNEIASQRESSITIASTFDPDKVRGAIEANQQKKTTYSEFLEGIACAGVVRYRVEMPTRQIYYCGHRLHEQLIEPVPV